MKRVSQKTITRALLYIRTLDELISRKRISISSKELAQITALTDVQIRKDISNFGKIGKPGTGYHVKKLKKTLEEFVLRQTAVRLVLFGAGNLGTAIMRFPGFHRDRIKLVAAFDSNKHKIGKKINGVEIYPVKSALSVIKKIRAQIGIIAVPADHSQNIADIIVASGLKGIVNFSPTSISVPQKIPVRDIDLTIEFLSLFYETKH